MEVTEKKITRVAITFDLDLLCYEDGVDPSDEVGVLLQSLDRISRRIPAFHATLFVRLDDQVARSSGQPDYLLLKYDKAFAHLKHLQHEIGWHLHSYTCERNRLVQNTDGPGVADEIGRLSHRAVDLGLRAMRMGWGFHTNETMRAVAAAGFLVDSSAIPRPRYAWEESVKDWTTTPLTPYYPSVADYRVPGKPDLPVLEMPISVAPIPAPYDTGEVLRYFNLAYHPELLLGPLQGWMRQHDHLITVTHPYELAPHCKPHGLLAFGPEALERNLLQLEEVAREQCVHLVYVTISRMAETYK